MKILLYVLLCLFLRSLQVHVISSILPECMTNCRQKSPPNENPYQFYKSRDRWFKQKLDHLDRNNKKTWKQRYRVIDMYYNSKKNGPIFLYVGGEYSVPMYIGAWIIYAKELNALCFYVEHRYYGTSRPTKDLSTENLIYLSSEQALADLVKFIHDIPKIYKEHNIPTTAKWVVFGGSYSGTLAVWLKQKYPNLVYAAVASSAPVVAKLDFKEYFEDIESSLPSDCASKIKEAIQMIINLLQTTKGQEKVRSKFKLCESRDGDKNINVEELLKRLRVFFTKHVSNGYWRRTCLVETLCDIMVKNSNESAVDSLADVNDFMLINKVRNCLPNENSYFDIVKSSSWGSHTNRYRQWHYQLCTEFGLFQSANQNNSIFLIDDPINNFVHECNGIFGTVTNLEEMSAKINTTNERNGGLDIQASRIIYVNGLQDPWHHLGIIRTKIKNTISINVTESTHCEDFEFPLETDLPQIKKAREYILFYLKQWLEGSEIKESLVIELENLTIKMNDIKVYPKD